MFLEGVPGKTHGARVAWIIAMFSVIGAIAIAMLTELKYEPTVPTGPRELSTNGSLQPAVAASAFLLCCTSAFICTLRCCWLDFRKPKKDVQQER
jgi:hypothetical protein